MELNKGDKFVRVSKYGSVICEVKEIYRTYVSDFALGCVHESWKVKSTNGITYDYGECFKISRLIPEEDCRKSELFLKSLQEAKTQFKKDRMNIGE
jgi:hypothetical protein